MENQEPNIGIRLLAEDERPREKLMQQGPRALSNAELLAILINSGNKNASALHLARQAMLSANFNLQNLQSMSWQDLSKIKGIGSAKAITLTAAFELGKRRREEEAREIQRISNSREAYLQFEYLMEDYKHEEFWVLYLNRANGIIAKSRLSEGGTSGTVVDPKVLFFEAIKNMASNIILCHNHPSGNLTPSQQDIDITKKICAGARLLDIYVRDHLILGNRKYFSFADEGMI